MLPRKIKNTDKVFEVARFFARWVRAPLEVGGCVPSSAALAREMARPVDPARAGYVLELGGGTGMVTRALLRAGVAPDRLVVIESHPEFHRLLQAEFGGCTVIRGDARYLDRLLPARGIERLNAVVSSLPMLAIPTPALESILLQAFELLDRDGLFLQYTYGPKAPVPERVTARLALEARPIKRIWLNAPPATVWCFSAGLETASAKSTARARAA